MFSKLLKYDFKSTSRVMWFLYLGIIVAGLLLGFALRSFTSSIEAETLTGGSDSTAAIGALLALGGILVIMGWAIAIVTIIMIILRFNKNILGDEGYLMHTLPVTTEALIGSKLLVSLAWIAIGGLSGLIAVIMMLLSSGFLGWLIENNMIAEIIRQISEVLNINVWLYIALIIVCSVSGVLMFYFSMAIGNLANKNKFLYAVLAYIGIQIVISVILSIIGASIGSGIVMVETGYADGTSVISWTLNKFIISNLIVYAVMAVVSFIGTDYILKKRLNLA